MLGDFVRNSVMKRHAFCISILQGKGREGWEGRVVHRLAQHGYLQKSSNVHFRNPCDNHELLSPLLGLFSRFRSPS